MKKLLKLALAFFLFAASGCAGNNKYAVLSLLPAGDSVGLPGYQQLGNTGVLTTRELKMTVTPLTSADVAGQPELLRELVRKDYVVIRMEIENLSLKKIIFNPVYAVLTTDSFDYKKPLEYTDFYDLAGKADGKKRERKVNELKGKFYDLATTLAPGHNTSRMLIFPPLSKNSAKADLLIKELYIGTETVEFYFPFTIKGE